MQLHFLPSISYLFPTSCHLGHEGENQVWDAAKQELEPGSFPEQEAQDDRTQTIWIEIFAFSFCQSYCQAHTAQLSMTKKNYLLC